MATPPDILQTVLHGLKPRPLHRTLFNLANSYNQVADLSFDKIAETKNADFAAPAILCRSFAIELLLKFFIVVRYPTANRFSELEALGVNLEGHTYSILYERIDKRLRELIANVYSEQAGQVTTAAQFCSFLIATGDKPFVDWRYVYESRETKHLDPPLFDMLANSLGLAAQSEVRRLNTADE